MKNLIKFSFVFAAAIMILASCNKEKAAIKKFEGVWNLTSSTASEESDTCVGTAPASTTTLTFVSYEFDGTEKGDVITAITSSGVTFRDTSDYLVSEDGKELMIYDGATLLQTLMINKLTNKKAELSYTDSAYIVTSCTPLTGSDKLVTYTWNVEKQ
jgi:hypothetical protein